MIVSFEAINCILYYHGLDILSILLNTFTMKINKTSPDKHNYLQPLVHIAKSPKTLYVSGELPADRVPTVAIVGTRKPTPYGREVTQRLANDLARKGIVILSGLALGVDGIAHQAALDAGGKTIAVLGNGLPDIYPRAHQQLAERILNSGGAIISEYPADTPTYPANFLQRNRIVSGLADAIIITEAAAKSGTLNTASHALDQGKAIFVVPGNITSPLSAGCNALLKQGAAPITDAGDVIEVIAADLLEDNLQLPLGRNDLETQVLKLIQEGLRSGDEIQRQLNIETRDFNTTLTMMEIGGLIKPLGANQWTVR